MNDAGSKLRCKASIIVMIKSLLWQWQVQRHLQMRIEAQGKYLQSILEKAKETLAGHTSDSPGLEAAHAELTELASKVTTVGMIPTGFSNLGMSGLPQPDALMSMHQLPRQPSRNSDSSSQKSFLTNLTGNAEDSGGVTGSGEPHGANGRLTLQLKLQAPSRSTNASISLSFVTFQGLI